MSIPLPHWVRCETMESVTVPPPDGKSPVKTIQVKVPAWKDPEDGEIYLDGESIRILDDARAHHMGLMATTEIRDLRQKLGLTQKRLSELLQIGEKTWTRWESGRERPSKSLNVLICALRDGRIGVSYLEGLLSGTAVMSESKSYIPVLTSADIRWSDLLADFKWKADDTIMSAQTATQGGELAHWIKSFVTAPHFLNETKESEHNADVGCSSNIIPFLKAS